MGPGWSSSSSSSSSNVAAVPTWLPLRHPSTLLPWPHPVALLPLPHPTALPPLPTLTPCFTLTLPLPPCLADEEGIIEFLVKENNFSEDRVRKAVKKVGGCHSQSCPCFGLPPTHKDGSGVQGSPPGNCWRLLRNCWRPLRNLICGRDSCVDRQEERVGWGRHGSSLCMVEPFAGGGGWNALG